MIVFRANNFVHCVLDPVFTLSFFLSLCVNMYEGDLFAYKVNVSSSGSLIKYHEWFRIGRVLLFVV